MAWLKEITYVQYVNIIIWGSVIGVLLGEILRHFVAQVRDEIESLEKVEGTKLIFIGLSISVFPVLCHIGIVISEMYEQLFQSLILGMIEKIMIAFYVMGAVYLIRGFTKFVLAIRNG